ncbi:MAG: aminotransferase class V-fold PLP-dependent enzyme [Deltaproteobacteria bacterium]|nr:aminotransferase class V-fold PLP-dependent enzyme [Deltaproteobacteria bacterium]
MKVPLLDLQAQYAPIRAEIRAAMDRVCDAQHFILGPEVSALEEEVAQFCGARFGVGVSSGTDALLVALMAAGVGPGDEVITSSFTFFATAGVIVRLGARPVFVDIDAGTFNLKSEEVQTKLTSCTKAIVPVHLFGLCAELSSILEIAGDRGIHVIEDAAQAIGAGDRLGRSAGTIGDMGCFSFFPSKNLGAFGDAGMIVTNDADLAESLRVLRVHGGKPKYYHRVVGGNFRLDALQAAVLRVKLKHLTAWTEARRRNAQRYRELFAESGLQSQVTLPQDTPGHIYNQFVIRVPRRDELRSFLRQNGVETEIYYPVPLHLQDCFADLGYRKGELPESEKAAAQVLALPIYPELLMEQQRHVVEQIRRYLDDGAQAPELSRGSAAVS